MTNIEGLPKLFMTLFSEVDACGVACAGLVLRRTAEWERLDALYLAGGDRPRCIACERWPDVPAGFVSIHADGGSVVLPAPFCDVCAVTEEKLRVASMKILKKLFPSEVKFWFYRST